MGEGAENNWVFPISKSSVTATVFAQLQAELHLSEMESAFLKRSVHKCQGKAIKILGVCSRLMISGLQEKLLNTSHFLIIANFRCLARLRI